MEMFFVVLALYFMITTLAMFTTIIAMVVICDKAGESAWAPLVPLWNVLVWCQIGGCTAWLILVWPIIGFQIVNYYIFRRFGYAKPWSLLGAVFWFVGLPVLAISKTAYSPADPPAHKWPSISTYEDEIVARLQHRESVDDVSWDLLARTSDLTRRDIVDYMELVAAHRAVR